MPRGVELDLVDALAEAVERLERGRVLVREAAELERRAAADDSEFSALRLALRGALPPERLDERAILGEEVVPLERRRLVRGAQVRGCRHARSLRRADGSRKGAVPWAKTRSLGSWHASAERVGHRRLGHGALDRLLPAPWARRAGDARRGSRRHLPPERRPLHARHRGDRAQLSPGLEARDAETSSGSPSSARARPRSTRSMRALRKPASTARRSRGMRSGVSGTRSSRTLTASPSTSTRRSDGRGPV